MLNLEHLVNENIKNVTDWFNCNKLSLNIDKTNFVIFHPPQKKVALKIKVIVNSIEIKQANSIRYLGVHIDGNLNWKEHVHYVSRKIKRSIGILSKIRNYVTPNVITQLYYSPIYPYLTYGIVIWGNTYKSTLYPIVTLQKRIVRIITFSKFDEHSSPLFERLNILKFVDLVFLHNALFMHDYHFNNLSPSFKGFFSQVSLVHDHNTRTASRNTYYIDQIITNYGRFSLRFQGPKAWNTIDDKFKSLRKPAFKKEIAGKLIRTYTSTATSYAH